MSATAPNPDLKRNHLALGNAGGHVHTRFDLLASTSRSRSATVRNSTRPLQCPTISDKSLFWRPSHHSEIE